MDEINYLTDILGKSFKRIAYEGQQTTNQMAQSPIGQAVQGKNPLPSLKEELTKGTIGGKPYSPQVQLMGEAGGGDFAKPGVAKAGLYDTSRKPIHDATQELFNVYAKIDKSPGTLSANELKSSLEKLRKITNDDELFFGYSPEAEYAIGNKAKEFQSEVGDKQFRYNMIDALEHYRTTLHRASESPELAMHLGATTPEEITRLEQLFSDALANQNGAPGHVLSKVAPKTKDILEGKTTVKDLVGEQNLGIGRPTYDLSTIKNRLERNPDYQGLVKKYSVAQQPLSDVKK